MILISYIRSIKFNIDLLFLKFSSDRLLRPMIILARTEHSLETSTIASPPNPKLKGLNYYLRTHLQLEDLPGHADEVYTVDWSPDGERVASGGKDRNLKMWRR